MAGRLTSAFVLLLDTMLLLGLLKDSIKGLQKKGQINVNE
jgi:hypothetical protein